MLLPKQQTQAEAWRLFIVSGSLAWLRRPRLASFTSTTVVETNHPLVTARPRWSFVKSTVENFRSVRAVKFKLDLAILFNVANRSRYFTFRVALGERLAAILLLATFGESQLHFCPSLFEVELQWHDREGLGLYFQSPLIDLVAMYEKFSPAVRVVTAESNGVTPRRNMHLKEPKLIVINPGVALGDLCLSLSQ